MNIIDSTVVSTDAIEPAATESSTIDTIGTAIDAENLFDLEQAPGVDRLDLIEGYAPIVVPIASNTERVALRDATLDASESATLFQTISSSHPLDEENAEDGEEFEDQNGETVSPYATLYALAAQKKGLFKTKKAFGGQTDRLKWSRIFRPTVVKQIAESRGWRLRTPEWSYRHPTVPKMSCSVQWEADITGSGVFMPLEIKIVGGSERWKWRNESGEYVVPAPTMIRVQHIMAVTGCKRVMVIGFFGGNEERLFLVDRDEELIGLIETSVTSFWQMLDAGDMPQPDYGRDLQVIKSIDMKIDPEKILDWTGDNEAKMLLAKKADHAAKKKVHEEAIQEIDGRLWERMGDASAANLGETILGVTVIGAKEIKSYRESYKKFTTRKASTKHAGTKSKSKKAKTNE